MKNTCNKFINIEHEIFSANKYENANNSREIYMLSYVKARKNWQLLVI